MSLGLAMHAKWDGISMATPPMHSYKHERPVYSTPQPVEITPTNNECRLVELRGAKVASFILGGEEYICLPQAFDLFLKHLVGGLHTVYTKLKRLSITPVVCNVEQVRVLRGLGAIQPGVNRCKLITRKDFEILHQDCTQASRPGRPPKRYPMLPPTTDLSSHYPAMRSMAAAAHGILGAADLNALHKRMRLDQDAESSRIHQQERRLSGSPHRDAPALSSNDLSNEMHANATNLYLQQAIRQAAATGIHNGGLDPQQAMAAAGMNPAALAPLMMMSHPALFSGTFSPGMLNHISQITQNRGASNSVTSAAAAAAAQIAVNGGNMHQQAAAAYQVAAQASLAANSSPHGADRERSFLQDGKTSEGEERESPKRFSVAGQVNSPAAIPDGGGSEGCDSPRSSLSSSPLHGENHSVGSASGHSDSGNFVRSPAGDNGAIAETPIDSGIRRHSAEEQASPAPDGGGNDVELGDTPSDQSYLPEDVAAELTGPANCNSISSMQTLLTNIQGLLKVAADNARLQEKHSSFELADLRSRMALERQKRDDVEKKLEESEKMRALVQRRLKKERKMREILQEQLDSIKQQPGREGDASAEKIPSVASVPITGVFGSGRRPAGNVSPFTAVASPKRLSPKSGSFSSQNRDAASSPNAEGNSPAISSSGQGATMMTPPSLMTSPADSGECGPFSLATAVGNNSNNSNSKTLFLTGEEAGAMAAAAHFTEDRIPSRDLDPVETSAPNARREMPGSHSFFNSGHFQTAATQ